MQREFYTGIIIISAAERELIGMHDVFISYGSKDAGVVDAVCRVLETNGIKCWIAPRDIPTGSNYAREIPAAIRGCTVFLLMMQI